MSTLLENFFNNLYALAVAIRNATLWAVSLPPRGRRYESGV
ncbi:MULTISPECIES: hypothetical protein [Kamptonema]|nr:MULTISPECIES: hypothetical protein [Kamptonema]